MKGKLELPKNLGIKNTRGNDHEDKGRGIKGGKRCKTPIGSKEAKAGKSPYRGPKK